MTYLDIDRAISRGRTTVRTCWYVTSRRPLRATVEVELEGSGGQPGVLPGRSMWTCVAVARLVSTAVNHSKSFSLDGRGKRRD